MSTESEEIFLQDNIKKDIVRNIQNILDKSKGNVLCEYYQRKLALSISEILSTTGPETIEKLLSEYNKPYENNRIYSCDNYYTNIEDRSCEYYKIFSSLIHSSIFTSTKCPKNVIVYILKELPYLLKRENEYTVNMLLLLNRILKCHGKEIDYFSEELLINLMQKLTYLSLTQNKKTKSLVYKTSNMILNVLQDECFYSHFSLEFIPVSGFDTKDIVKRYSSQYFKKNPELILHKILYLYSNNTLNRDGGIILEKLLEHYTWQEFETTILLMFISIAQDNPNSTFENSVIKYFIPKVTLQFPEQFYKFSREKNLLSQYKIHLHICLNRQKKKKNPLNIFSVEEINNCCESELSSNTIEMLTTSIDYNPLVKWEVPLINIVLDYMKNASHEDFRNSFKLLIDFVSKLLQKSASPNLNKYYLDVFLLIFNCGVTCLLSSKVTRGSLIIDVIWRASDITNNKENTHKTLFAEYIQENYWNITLNSDFLKEILIDNVSDINSALYNLIRLRYPEEWVKINFMSLMDLYNICTTEICLEVIEDFKVFCQLPLCVEDIDIYKQGFVIHIKDIQNGQLTRPSLMNTILCLQVLIVTKFVDVSLAEKGLEAVLNSIPILKNDNLDNVTVKLYERLIVDTLSLLDTNIKAEVMDYKAVFIKVYQIIETCNLRRPTNAAINTIKKISIVVEQDVLLKREIIELVLNTLEKTPKAEQLTHGIRRNPETSYVLHGLCLPINRNFGPINTVMSRLFSIVNNTQSVIHLNYVYNCFQVLMSDSVFHVCTEMYIQPLLKSCFKHFSIGFLVRIAVTSLFSVLLKRIFGAGPLYNKQHSLQEVYYKYGDIINFLIKNFNPNNPNKTLTISFFEQSCSREYPFKNVNMENAITLFKDKIKSYLTENKYCDSYIKLSTCRALVTVFKDCELEELCCDTDLNTSSIKNTLLERLLLNHSNFNWNLLNNRVIKNGVPSTVLFLLRNGSFEQFVLIINSILRYPKLFVKIILNSDSIVERLSKYKTSIECKEVVNTLIEQYFTTDFDDCDLKVYSYFLVHLFQEVDFLNFELKLNIPSLLMNMESNNEIDKTFIGCLILLQVFSNLPEEHELNNLIKESLEVNVEIVFCYIIECFVNFDKEAPINTLIILNFLTTLAFQFKYRLNVMKILFLVLVNPNSLITYELNNNIIVMFIDLFGLKVENMTEALQLIFSKEACLNYIDEVMYVDYINYCECFIDAIPEDAYNKTNFYVSKTKIDKRYLSNMIRLHKIRCFMLQ